MGSLTTLLSFVAVLGIIIFFHEFGHFITAKAFGMRVFIFSFGFGRRLFGFKWGDTDCRVSLIPLGGYVKMTGEQPGDVAGDSRLPDALSGSDHCDRRQLERVERRRVEPEVGAELMLQPRSRGGHADALLQRGQPALRYREADGDGMDLRHAGQRRPPPRFP